MGASLWSPAPFALAIITSAVGCVLSGGCGARTALEDPSLPPREDSGAADVTPPVAETGAGDAGPDSPPILDSGPIPDAAPSCPAGGLTAYLLSEDNTLYSYDPPSLATHPLGPLACPTPSLPWTLTASSSGSLYVIYQDWDIYRVDPTTLACIKTPYVAGQLSLGGDDTLTVAPGDGGDDLYIYGQNAGGETILGVGDLVHFVLREVGAVTPAPDDFPLDIRADAFGRIFGLGAAGTFAQIDPQTGAVLSQHQTNFSSGTSSWALLTWNSSIYFFSGGAVSQYDRQTNQVTPVGNVALTVVGASAAPCIH
jgi:hypothetical protein